MFREPPATTALYLPAVTMVRVEADGEAVRFTGDFRRVDRPSRVRLAPMDPEDGRGLAQALSSRFGLPKTPRVVEPSELAHMTKIELVTVVGTRRAVHCDCPDFEGIRLHSDALLSDGCYRVTGILTPGSPLGSGIRAIGYLGPVLAVLWLEMP